MSAPHLPASFRYGTEQGSPGVERRKPATRTAIIGFALAIVLATGLTAAFVGIRMAGPQDMAGGDGGGPAGTLTDSAQTERRMAAKTARIGGESPAVSDAGARDMAQEEPIGEPKGAQPEPPLADSSPRWVSVVTRPVRLEDLIKAPAEPDAGVTASISSLQTDRSLRTFTPREEAVPVTEDDEEIAALEAAMVEEQGSADDMAREDDMAGGPEAAPAAARPAGLGEARVNAYVNMRSGPDNNSQVVTVVPANARIAAANGCRHWCEVVYEGRRGFIYKDYIVR